MASAISYLQYKMFLLNENVEKYLKENLKFTIQNVPIKYQYNPTVENHFYKFTIQNVPIK